MLKIEPNPHSCHGCGTSLKVERGRYDFMLERGFDPKDASAIILHAPSVRAVPKQCCIVNLQTNLDPDKGLRDRQFLMQEIEEEQAADLRARGLPPKAREEVELYVSNLDRRVPGFFAIYNSHFTDPSLLAPAAGSGEKGFEITDIAPITKAIADHKGWGSQRPLALWSGYIKIVPELQTGVGLVPGVIHAININGPEAGKSFIIDKLDKSFIGAEIIDFSVRMWQKDVQDATTGQIIKVDVPLPVMRIRKRFAEEIFH